MTPDERASLIVDARTNTLRGIHVRGQPIRLHPKVARALHESIREAVEAAELHVLTLVRQAEKGEK